MIMGEIKENPFKAIKKVLKKIYRKFVPYSWRVAFYRFRTRERERERERAADSINRYIKLTTQHQDRESKKVLLKRNLRIIEIEISSFCNRTCWFCPNSIIDRKSKIHFPESVFLKLMQNLSEIEYEGSLNFHRFNETLADKELILTRLSQARAHLPKANLGIFTNGDYLTREYLDELRDAGMNNMLMSYYLKENERFDIENVIKPAMQRMAKKLKLSYDGGLIKTSDREEYAITFDYEGAHIIYRCWNPETSGGDRGGVIESIKSREKQVRSCGCYFPLASIYVDYNCLAMPCCNLRSDVGAHKDFILGDVREQDLFELFSNDKYIAMRKMLTPNTPKSGPCASCHYDAREFLV